MLSPELSLPGKLDNSLTKGFCFLFGGLINALIWLLGLFSLAALVSEIFEYGEGLADVSWDEWGFMLFFVLLLWRHIRYSQYFATGFWKGLSRLLIFQGRLACAWLSVFGLLVIFEQQAGAPIDLINTVADPVAELTVLGFALLALYLAAPTAPAQRSRSTTTSSVEPTLTNAEKEVTA